MANEIIWSPLALETFEGIIAYLQNKFGEVAVRRFVKSVDDKINLIASRPVMFRPTGIKENTFITSIRKKATLTYRYFPDQNRIELVVFWGMQNPDNNPLVEK